MHPAITLTILLAVPLLSFGQIAHSRMEAMVTTDNDVFTGDIRVDQYYSHGLYVHFRMVQDSTKGGKTIRSYHINQQMYTPSWIGWVVPAYRDRPYAGVLSVSVTNEYYRKSGHYLRAELEMGVIGPASRVGATQKKWHEWINRTPPQGWEDQITNGLVLNLRSKTIKSFFESRNLELSNELTINLGTTDNRVRYDLLIRSGNLKTIVESAFVGAALGTPKQNTGPKTTRESYLFYSPGLEYVLYDGTLQGALLASDSPVTVDPIRVILQHRLGFMLSWPLVDWGFILHWRTKANSEAHNHKYGNIRLNWRF